MMEVGGDIHTSKELFLQRKDLMKNNIRNESETNHSSSLCFYVMDGDLARTSPALYHGQKNTPSRGGVRTYDTTLSDPPQTKAVFPATPK